MQPCKLNSMSKHTKTRNTSSNSLSQQEKSNINKYFKDNTLLESFKSQQDLIADDTLKIMKENESNLDKYFKDSIHLSTDYIEYNEVIKEVTNDEHTQIKNDVSQINEHHSLHNTKTDNYLKCNIIKERNNDDNYDSYDNYNNKKCVNNTLSNRKSTSTIMPNNNDSNSCTKLSSHIYTQDYCKLANWGLPSIILQKYEVKGISIMFPWQVECLSNQKVLEGKRNLLYSAPTSAGKTLVAEILLLKTVLEQRKKAIFVLPFVSVVREKVYYFQDLLSESGVKVEGFMGGISPPGGFAAIDIAITTIEKANSIINHLIEDRTLSIIGAIVIDELHLVGDSNRGYLLELLLTKLKYKMLQEEDINIQLIGMSATLPNLSLLAEWLNAELYKTEFRPIPLYEQCKIGNSIYDNKFQLLRNLEPLSELQTDTDNIIQLCLETISSGTSVLIFCPTKNWCEKLAHQIATMFAKLVQKDSSFSKLLKQQISADCVTETIEQLKRTPSGLDRALKNTVSCGVAFHHAGLTMDERDIIEGAFRSGSVRILIATSTLSSGVNLPARRVIIRSPMFGGKTLDILTYKQMIGRAGRTGKDTAGESILICKPNERKASEYLLTATLSPIQSCLEDAGPLIRTLLEAIANESVHSQTDLDLYVNCTLASLHRKDNITSLCNDAIKYLVDNEFILLQTRGVEQRWIATPLGKACLSSSIPPMEGLFLFEELQRARKCFVLDTELHVVYLVTPINSGSQITTVNWMTFLEIWKTMSDSERRVGQLIGVEEHFLISAIKGIVRPGKLLRVHKRFYTALALHDLVRETPLNSVCDKYGCCRGVMQSLQQAASTFAGMVTQFCKQLGWNCMELLVAQFQTRLQFGVCRELLDLLRLPMLNGLRARSLYKEGITSVAELATANIFDIERALYKALPFESEKVQNGEHEVETILRNKIRTIFVTGRDGLTPQEAAIILSREARKLIEDQFGLYNVPWDHNYTTNKSTNINTTQSHTTANNISKRCNISRPRSIDIIKQIEIIENSNIQNNSTAKLLQKEEEKEEKRKDERIVETTNVKENSSKIIHDIKINSDSKHLECVAKEENSANDDIKKEHVDQLIELKSLDLNDFNFSALNSKRIHTRDNNDKNLNKPYRKSLDVSRSPSLFDESLNLDTQACNILEQNILDSLCISSNKIEEFKSPVISDCRLECSLNNHDNKLAKHVKSYTHISNKRSLNNEQSQIEIVSWNDDSWNQTEKVMKKMKRLNEEITNHNNIKNLIITDIKSGIQNDNVSQKQSKDLTNISSWNEDSWNELKPTLNVMKNNLNKENNEVTSIDRWYKNIQSETNQVKLKFYSSVSKENVNEILQESKLRKLSSVQDSPIVNKTHFNKDRKLSVESNKSDSDDIVVSSTEESPIIVRNRMKAQLRKVQKLHTQVVRKNELLKLKSAINTPAEKMSKDINVKTGKSKPKLKDLLEKNSLSIGYSTDSLVSNSDGDTPVKIAKIEQFVSKTNSPRFKRKHSEVQINLLDHKSSRNSNENDWNTLNIIQVGSDRATFNLFKREIMKNTNIALSLLCDIYVNETGNIGKKIVSTSSEGKRLKKIDEFVYENKRLCGLAISWETNIAYYISLINTPDVKVPIREQVKFLEHLFSNTLLHVRCFAAKEAYKLLYHCCKITASCRFLDLLTADWLLHGTVSEKSFNEMVSEYFPEGLFILQQVVSSHNPKLHIKHTFPPEFKTCAETILIWHTMDILLSNLEKLSSALVYMFKEIEMRSIIILASMELTGLGVSLKSLQELSSVIRDEMLSLEERGYSLAGQRFNFLSSKEVSQVLGLYKGKKISTNKTVLQKCDNPISSIVISWRKLNSIYSRTVKPLLSSVDHDSRVHGSCITYTLTGRVSMNEPNLQNIPKDFNSEDNSFVISTRMAFIPTAGNVMLSADYCQLELRILAHFCKDIILCEILRKEGDIFKTIAAKWNCIPEEQVDEKMRQDTKQLCYGMIYGMSTKTLAESLSISEREAKTFLDSFMNVYPGIRQWLNDVLIEARERGYITTIMERRRILPGLKASDSFEKALAERQAINTKVQGSAADIVKQAMVNIEDRIRHEFPNSAVIMPEINTKQKLRTRRTHELLRGGYLVLQLHDELLYEVNMMDLQQMVIIIKKSMEHACQLAVPLPVKIKVGPTWGDLKEYHI